MTVRVFECIPALNELRGVWGELLTRTPNATFFQSLEWLETYWTHFAGDQELRVFQITEENQPAGLVPFVIRREATRLGTIRVLTYPLDYWGSFYGPISTDPAGALRQTLSCLEAHCDEWDVLELRWLGVTEEEHNTAEAIMRSSGFSPILGLLDSTAIIDLSGTWDSYLASRGSKWRNNLKRWRKRLNKAGNVRYERYRSSANCQDPRWDLFDDCLTVAKHSWQADSTDGTTLSHAPIREFIRDSHQAAADIGCLDMNLMYLDEQPVAFAYNYQYQGHVFGLRIGHDPAVRSLAVGNVLYAHALEDSFARGDWRYDMGPGSLECKRHLQTDLLNIYRLSFFRDRSLRQRLLRWKRQRDAISLVDQSA